MLNKVLVGSVIGGLYAGGGLVYKKLVSIHKELEHFEGALDIRTRKEEKRHSKEYIKKMKEKKLKETEEEEES